MSTPTQLYKLLNDRYSLRDYSDRRPTPEEIRQIIEAARIAPSACNRQPWIFAIADTPDLCDEIKKCYDRSWINNVTTFIIACGDHDQAWHRADGKDHTDIDVAIAIDHITLAAAAMGLGTCWVCNFDAEKLRQALNIPPHIEPIAIIPVGYPATGSETPLKKRKQPDEITVWGRFQ